jgi:two-component system NarL family sensor kinase
MQLYRIAQEALNNIGKHSQAKQAVLVARQGCSEPTGFFGQGRPILFSISDDGEGLQSKPGLQSRPGLQSGSDQQAEETGDGFGMRTMRQRAAILGAQIDFISIEGGGLMVCVKIPARGG